MYNAMKITYIVFVCGREWDNVRLPHEGNIYQAQNKPVLNK